MSRLVYLDANAGIAAEAVAWQAWCDAQALPCAPQALHAGGRRSRQILRLAQSQIAQAIGADADSVHLVSGGTEADALALSVVCAPPGAAGCHGAGLPHVVTTGVEHAAVAKTLDAWAKQGRLRYEAVAACRSGVVDPAAIARAITAQTRLVSMTWACNETGVLQPIAEVAALCRARGVLLHTDAVQAVGRVPLDVSACGVDMLSLSGHKLGAVGGTGAVWMRPGTPATSLYADSAFDNVPGAASLAAVLRHGLQASGGAAVRRQRDALEAWARGQFGARLEVLGADAQRLGNTSCMRFVGCSAEAMMMALDVADIAIATGSACSTGALEPSPLLLGMGLSPEEARQTVRISFAAPIDAGVMQRLQKALIAGQKALSGRRF